MAIINVSKCMYRADVPLFVMCLTEDVCTITHTDNSLTRRHKYHTLQCEYHAQSITHTVTYIATHYAQATLLSQCK